jgi:molybdenum cofactor cytidylyltransferase
LKTEQPYIKYCAVIILAGGKSSRLGTPKQLLRFKDKNLVQHAADTAKIAGLEPVIVVLGSGMESIESGLFSRTVKIVENKNWEEGMASSIRAGVEYLQSQSPGTDGTIIMVCDQPFVDAALLNKLLSTQRETGLPIVASAYEGISGTPVIYHQSFFAKLLELKGEKGAKKILEENPERVTTIAFPEGNIDIDTNEDYKNLEKW